MIERVDNVSDNFYTPSWLVDEIVSFFDGTIDLDPCADPQKRIPASSHYTFDQDGLGQTWYGNIFCNPPYSKGSFTSIIKWVAKAMATAALGNGSVLLLLPVNLDTSWGQLLLEAAASKNTDNRRCEIVFFAGRLRFLDSNYLLPKSSGRFASMLVYLGHTRTTFRTQFGKYGACI